MTELDMSYAGSGGDQQPEVRSMPFFPGPPVSTPPSGAPLPAPPPATPAVPAQGGRLSQERISQHPDSPDDIEPIAVEGRITIGDHVIEKIVTLAVMEVSGVVALIGQDERADGVSGVRIHQRDDEVTLGLGIAVAYRSVIVDVAAAVQANVARVTGRMLGKRVAAVNVSVEDVRIPSGA